MTPPDRPATFTLRLTPEDRLRLERDAAGMSSLGSYIRWRVSESDELSRGDVGAKIRELMAGIDDPATLIAQQDQRQHGTPGVQR